MAICYNLVIFLHISKCKNLTWTDSLRRKRKGKKQMCLKHPMVDAMVVLHNNRWTPCWLVAVYHRRQGLYVITLCWGGFQVIIREAHDPQLCALAGGKFCRSMTVMHSDVVLLLILELGHLMLMNASFVFGKIVGIQISLFQPPGFAQCSCQLPNIACCFCS